MISKENVYSQIKQSGNLPTLPEILLKLLNACDDEETSLATVAEIISRDPVLSLKVLQLVNSAYHGFQQTFSGIEQAVVYLGANAIKNLAISTSVHQVFRDKKYQDLSQFSIGDFWWHSLMSATVAKRLASLTGGCDPDEAYIAGLLHDIGKVLLVSTFPDTYVPTPVANYNDCSDKENEVKVVGIDHTEAGSWLVRQWNLNSMIADAIRYHHEPLDQVVEAFPLVKVVCLSGIMAHNRQDSDLSQAAAETLLGLNSRDFEEVAEGAVDEVNQIAADMKIKVTPPPAESSISDKAENEVTSVDTGNRKYFDQLRAPLSPKEDHEQTIQKEIESRVKNVSLMTTLLEDLVQAGDVDAILMAFEQFMTLLFDIDKVLFFLPDSSEILLKGQTSATNQFFDICKGLTLPVQNSTSLIAKTFKELTSPGPHVLSEEGGNIADQQILYLLKCKSALTIPLEVQNSRVGVVLLGLTDVNGTMNASDNRLITTISKQVALCLHLDKTKMQREEELQAERMAALSMTAKKFAHEINNPLGIISNYLVTMKLKLAEDPVVTDELNIIDEEIKRISSMVSQMDMYSQAQFTQFERVDINEVIRDIVQLAKSSLFVQPGTSLSFIPASGLLPVTSSKDAVKQILINLLKNCAEAMTDGGRVVIRTRKLSAGEAIQSEGVMIIVSDTGPGLPETVLENLFKPFVTTKQNGHSGLGLSIVEKAVSDIGGKIFCSSNSKEGTTFTIQLPGLLSDTLD